jgi:nucleoside-diphosphate-sugar epimerase
MISSQTRLQTVSLRLAMVYGSGGRGNLERMMQAVAAGWFPPLPETNNRRSLVHVEDVLDAMQMAAVHPGASGKIYIVAHPDCVSGRQLYTLMCEALGKRVPDVAVPEWLLRSIGRAGDIGGKLLGKRFPLDGQVVSRLLDSSWYSSELLTRELGWRAQVDLRVGLHSIAEGLGSK